MIALFALVLLSSPSLSQTEFIIEKPVSLNDQEPSVNTSGGR